MIKDPGVPLALCRAKWYNLGMFAWLQRLLRPATPSRADEIASQNVLDGLESRIDFVYQELKKLRGRVYANEKSIQDDPGETNDEHPSAGLGAHGVMRMRPLRRW